MGESYSGFIGSVFNAIANHLLLKRNSIMLKTIIICLLGITLATAQSFGQLRNKKLKIGDQVPNIEFKMFGSSNSKLNLFDIKQNWVILDFWGSFCKSCFERLPALDSIQKVYASELKVLMVNSYATKDNDAKINRFLKIISTQIPDFSIPTAYDDTIGYVSFPYNTVPHYVWIGPDRTVRAITGSNEISTDIVKRVLEEDNADFLPAKVDYYEGQLLDLEDERIIDKNLLCFRLFKKGKKNTFGVINQMRVITNANGTITPIGYTMINMPLVDMYRQAINLINGREFRTVTRFRFRLENVDSSQLLLKNDAIDKESWENQNLYTYDAVVGEKEYDDSIGYSIINDLNKFSDFTGRFERRTMKCLVIQKPATDAKSIAKGTENWMKYNVANKKLSIRSRTIEQLAIGIEQMENNNWNMPIIDESKYSAIVDMDIDFDTNDSKSFKKSMKEHGFDVVVEEKKILVFVIMKKAK